MTQSIALDPEKLQAMEPREDYPGGARLTPSVFDTPREVAVSPGPDGSLEVTFHYPDNEEAGPELSIGELWGAPVVVSPGRFSGKIIKLRVPVDTRKREPEPGTLLAGLLERATGK